MTDIVLNGHLYQKVSGSLVWDMIVKGPSGAHSYYRKVGPAPDARRELEAQQNEFNRESNELLREVLGVFNEHPKAEYRSAVNPHVRSDTYKLAARIEKHLGLTFGKSKL